MNLWEMLFGKVGATPNAAKTTTGTLLTPQFWRVGGYVPPSDYDAVGLTNAYRGNELVFACINVKMQAAVDARLIVERWSYRDGVYHELDTHPLRRLMTSPKNTINEAALVRAWIGSRDVFGKAYFEKVRNANGRVVEINPLNPAYVDEVFDQTSGDLLRYTWRDNGRSHDFKPDDIIAYRNYDPRSRWGSVSPTAVAMDSIKGDALQTLYVKSFFDGGGVPSGLLTIKNRTLSQVEANSIREKWRAMFSPSLGGRREDIGVLDENADFQVTGSRPDQLASDKLRGMTESRICMAYGVPPLIVYSYLGMQNSTYSNMQTAWRQFWESTLTPMLREYREWLQIGLLREFESDDDIAREDVRLWWDLSRVAALKENVDALQARARDNFAAGGITLNELREQLGMPADVHGDYYLRNAGATVVEANKPMGATPTTSPQKSAGGPSERKAGFEADQLRLRDDMAVMYVPKLEKYLHGEYTRAADAVAKLGKAGANNIETKVSSSVIYNAVVAILDDGTTLAGIFSKLYNQMAAKVAATVGQYLGISAVTAFDVFSPEFQREINGLLTKAVAQVTRTNIEQIKALIDQMQEKRWSVDDLAREIRGLDARFSKSRAEMIANTETANAHSRSSLKAYAESGVVEKVEWSAHLDERTSEVCKRLHGKVVKLGAAFEADITSPPAHPNCRSVLLPVLE